MSSERSEADATFPGYGLVNVPDPNGTGLVAVTLSTQHILSQASTYSLKNTDFSDTSAVQKKLKAVREYLSSQEAVVGASGLETVAQHFCKSIFKSTPYERIFPNFWKKSSKSWSSFLDKIAHAIGVPADHRLCDLAVELQSFTPGNGSNLRSALFDYAGKIDYLASKNAALVPHQLLLTRRLLMFTPVNQQHLLPNYIKEPATDQSLEDYIEGLLEAAMEIHPKIMPNLRAFNGNQDSNSKSRPQKAGKSQSNHQSNAKNNAQDGGNQQQSNAKGSQSESNNHNNSRHVRTDRPERSENQNPQRNVPHMHHRPHFQPQQRQAPSQSSGPRFVSNRPPPTTPKAPQVTTGDILMDGTGRPDPTSPLPATKHLGRLMKVAEEQVQREIFARIDTGADTHIAGKEILGYAVPDGVHKSLFSVPLQRKRLAAECVKFSATSEDGDDLEIRGVLSPSTNTC